MTTSPPAPQVERNERTSGTITEIVWTARDGETVAAFAVQHDTAAKTEFFTEPIETWSAPHLGIHRSVPLSATGSGHCRVIGGPCSHTTSGTVDAAKLLIRWREAEQDDAVIADALADLLASETETAADPDGVEGWKARILAGTEPKKFIEFPA
jgi:hypothetical protein